MHTSMPSRFRLSTTAARAALLGVFALVLAACSTLGAVGALLGNQVNFTQPQLQSSRPDASDSS